MTEQQGFTCVDITDGVPQRWGGRSVGSLPTDDDDRARQVCCDPDRIDAHIQPGIPATLRKPVREVLDKFKTWSVGGPLLRGATVQAHSPAR